MSKITPLEKRRSIHKSAKFPSACPNFPYFFKIQKTHFLLQIDLKQLELIGKLGLNPNRSILTEKGFSCKFLFKTNFCPNFSHSSKLSLVLFESWFSRASAFRIISLYHRSYHSSLLLVQWGASVSPGWHRDSRKPRTAITQTRWPTKYY